MLKSHTLYEKSYSLQGRLNKIPSFFLLFIELYSYPSFPVVTDKTNQIEHLIYLDTCFLYFNFIIKIEADKENLYSFIEFWNIFLSFLRNHVYLNQFSSRDSSTYVIIFVINFILLKFLIKCKFSVSHLRHAKSCFFCLLNIGCFKVKTDSFPPDRSNKKLCIQFKKFQLFF